MHVMAKPIPLNKRVPGRAFPPLLEQVMDRALAKKAEDRFASAADFAVAMQAVLQGALELPPEAFASSPKAIRPVAAEVARPPPGSAPTRVPTLGSAPGALALARKSNVPLLVGIALGFLLVGVGLAVGLMKLLAR
jgi:hypothetical protein